MHHVRFCTVVFADFSFQSQMRRSWSLWQTVAAGLEVRLGQPWILANLGLRLSQSASNLL